MDDIDAIGVTYGPGLVGALLVGVAEAKAIAYAARKPLIGVQDVYKRQVLGWDPAFRTGCKLAVVDPTGKVIGTTVIYPTAPTTPQKIKASKDLLKKIIPKYNISLI